MLPPVVVNVLTHKNDAVYISCSVWYSHCVISDTRVSVVWYLTAFYLALLIFGTFWWCSCIILKQNPNSCLWKFLIGFIWGSSFWTMKIGQVTKTKSSPPMLFSVSWQENAHESLLSKCNLAHSSAFQPTNVKMELCPFLMSVLRFVVI